MTKADLVREIQQRHGGFTNREALRAVDALFDIVKKRLLEGERVHIIGFGTWEIVRRKPRRGRNPITGEDIQLPGRRSLVFRPARAVRSFEEPARRSQTP
jgi:nucleoid DNA-binding protein